MADGPSPMTKRNGCKPMDGHFRNKELEYEQTIESWMLATIQDGITRYDDLHIDRIDNEWKSPNLWVPAAFQAYNLAVKIRDKEEIAFTVVAAFSLKTIKRHIGVDFNTREQLETHFDYTPPSLYLFLPGTEPWVQAEGSEVATSSQDIVVEKINPAIFGEVAAPKDHCWYMEFKHHDEEGYCRSIFVTDGLLERPVP